MYAMGIFNRRQRREEKDNAQLIVRLDGRSVRYVARRELDESGSPVETVLGKTGRINTRDGKIVIICDGTEVFRCSQQNARCGELLSLGGVVIENMGAGKTETVVAYYTYYR